MVSYLQVSPDFSKIHIIIIIVSFPTREPEIIRSLKELYFQWWIHSFIRRMNRLKINYILKYARYINFLKKIVDTKPKILIWHNYHCHIDMTYEFRWIKRRYFFQVNCLNNPWSHGWSQSWKSRLSWSCIIQQKVQSLFLRLRDSDQWPVLPQLPCSPFSQKSHLYLNLTLGSPCWRKQAVDWVPRLQRPVWGLASVKKAVLCNGSQNQQLPLQHWFLMLPHPP